MSESLSALQKEFENNCELTEKNSSETRKKSKELNDKLNKEKKENDQVLHLFKKYKPIDTNIIKLNVGGTLFSTLKSTLIKKIRDHSMGDFYQPSIFEGKFSHFSHFY